MGFKRKAKKAKAKAEAEEKARIEWEAEDEAELDVMATRADEARALAKAESEAKAAAEAEAKLEPVEDANTVSGAEAEADPEPEPVADAEAELDANYAEVVEPEPESVWYEVADAEAKSDPVADAEAELDANYTEAELDAYYGEVEPEPESVWYEGVKYRAQCLCAQFRLYYTALEDCGPFDVDTFPATLTFGMLSPCHYKTDYEWRGKVDKCVRDAIAFAKKEKKMELAYPEVVKANWEISGGFVFYITFKAMDKKSGKRQLYESKVLVNSVHILGPGPSYVRLIRVKNQQKNKVIEE